MARTCTEIYKYIKKEDCIRDAVKHYPVCTEIIVEERYGNWQNDEIGNQQNKHEEVPVKSETEKKNIKNTELNGWRMIVCFRKYKVSIERLSVCSVIGKLAEHGIHCVPCSETNDVISDTTATESSCWCQSDVIETSFCQGIKHNIWFSIVALITHVWRHLTYNSRGAWHTLYMLLLNYK